MVIVWILIALGFLALIAGGNPFGRTPWGGGLKYRDK